MIMSDTTIYTTPVDKNWAFQNTKTVKKPATTGTSAAKSLGKYDHLTLQ